MNGFVHHQSLYMALYTIAYMALYAITRHTWFCKPLNTWFCTPSLIIHGFVYHYPLYQVDGFVYQRINGIVYHRRRHKRFAFGE